MHYIERQLPVKCQSLQSPAAAVPHEGAPTAPRLYTPRWRWSAASSAPPPVLGEAPQCYPLDILGVFDPPPAAASIHCTLPDAVLGATQRATQAFGASPFAVLLAILTVHETRLRGALGSFSNEPPIRVGLFGPGAAAVRLAVMAIHPEAVRHLADLYAVRGAPDDPNEDPLPRGVWPVLCPVFLPARPAPTEVTTPLPAAPGESPHENPERKAFAGARPNCSQRQVLASICADDAEASYLPPDVRRRVTALPGLMDRLYAALSFLAAPDDAFDPIRRFELGTSANFAEEMAETAFELAMVARAHLVAFYTRVRPARTGPVHRAAAALLRHRPLNVSPTTLTSGISGGDLRVLEAAGWLEPRDEETAHGLAHRFMPCDGFWGVAIAELPKKRATYPNPVDVLCDGPFSQL